ncbi:hypothetical protein ACFFP0_04490 [Rhizobium puerariae]|uniref:Uncharacterized protein n=1 Tax=Rhizobium puerariae TaxID=1585791 RepID=A0ABV6ABT1_9HYPH
MQVGISFVILLCAGGLAACTHGESGLKVVNIRTDFAKTNYGYVNSGGYRAGSLFSWDKAASRLVFRDNVPGFETDISSIPPTDSRITYQSGMTADASISLAVKARIDTVLKSDATIAIKDARRLTVSGVITRITNYMKTNGDLFEEWNFRESASNSDRYFLIVRDVTYGDSLDVEVNNEKSAGAGFPIKIGDASFQVKFTGKGLGNLSGNDIPITMNVYVLKAKFIENAEGGQNPTFGVVNDIDLKDLPELFRSVGSTS